MTEVPVVAFAILPSPPTAAESMTAYYDNGLATDFELSAYPYINVYTDFGEMWTQNVTISASNSADRFMHKIGVFSDCNSLDESIWAFEDLDDDVTLEDGIMYFPDTEYDLYINYGEFYQTLPIFF
jgi:hypothetical protein